ncbi:MAG: MipA/OmpV family protein [Mariprofundaceae bacterium]|nr:MipA/OmpV family protein [Mariprofundaceae bacterium]
MCNIALPKLKHGVLCVMLLFGMVITMFEHRAFAAENLPLWELGLGGGGITLPQYMGSDESYSIPFVFPYIIYRGERWQVGQGGIQGKLFDNNQISFEMSMSVGLPVRSDNQARAGMPDLLLTGEVGGKLNWYLHDSSSTGLIARFPMRAVVNINAEYIGWVADPVLSYRYYMPVEHGNFRTYIDLGLQYNSALYHDTYYGVDAIYATPDRAAYTAKQGLHSVFSKVWLRYPYNKKTELFATLQARSLASGIVSDSPLVRDNTYKTLTLGAIWLFATSDELVSTQD